MDCPYCGNPAANVGGDVVYPHRPDLAPKRFWVCLPCDARVGCHGTSDRPLGRLANAELRQWKMKAHAVFDPIWKERRMSRGAAYRWLAEMLGVEEVHIGEQDVAGCKEIVEICKGFNEGASA